MIKFLITILFFGVELTACNLNTTQKSGNDRLNDNPRPVSKPKYTNKFKDFDTSINVTLFDLTPFGTTLPLDLKKSLVTKAIKSTMSETDAYYYLEYPCGKWDRVNEESYTDTVQTAPDCRLQDFIFIDLDNDQDLDLIYSSNVDQYLRADTNYMLIWRNDNGVYTKYSISGYLYWADFSNQNNGTVTLKTASRGCCDEGTYKFFQTEISTRTWEINEEYVLEIPQKRVKEIL